MKSNAKVAGAYKNGAQQRFGGKNRGLVDSYKNFIEFCKKCDIELHVLDLQHIDKMINILPITERKSTLIEYAKKRKCFQNEYSHLTGGNGIARREANLWLLNLGEKFESEKLSDN